MNVWPIVVRELRAESRRPFNYWLRTLGAGAMVVVVVLITADPHMKPGDFGPRLFYGLNATLFAAIWILAPLLTADCLSREKREGTLGLLFLTSLRPTAIVVGKSLIHGGRALTLLLAAVPVLAFPLLLGGVAIQDVAMAAMLDSCALALALAAGLLASALIKDGTRVLFVAELLSLLLAFEFMCAHLFLFIDLNTRAGVFARMGFVPDASSTAAVLRWYRMNNSGLNLLLESFSLNTGWQLADPNGNWRNWFGLDFSWGGHWVGKNTAFQQAWFGGVGRLLGLAGAAFVGTIWIAAWHVARTWRETPASRRQILWLQFFCAPRFWRAVFRGKMTRLLDRNPIGWLQQCAWSARLARWGWCLALTVLEYKLVTDPNLTYLWTGQFFLAILLLLAVAFSASNSFRQERESGLMELLLVTPVKKWQIIAGRVRGLWGQFFPAALVLVAAWLYLAKDGALFTSTRYDQVSWAFARFLWISAGTYLALPLIGLYFSLKPMHFVTCWALTCGCGILLPWFVCGWGLLFGWPQLTGIVVGQQALSGAVAARLLYRDLARRRFL